MWGQAAIIKPQDKFGRLEVVGRVFPNSQDNRPRYSVKCKCGTEKVLCSRDLLHNKTQSCGCLKIEYCQSRKKPRPNCNNCGKPVKEVVNKFCSIKCFNNKGIGKYALPEREEFVQLVANSSISELGRHYKVSRSTIHKWMNDYAIFRTGHTTKIIKYMQHSITEMMEQAREAKLTERQQTLTDVLQVISKITKMEKLPEKFLN